VDGLLFSEQLGIELKKGIKEWGELDMKLSSPFLSFFFSEKSSKVILMQ